MIQTDLILTWYKGKARENAETALQLLLASEAIGEWVPGASRKVIAALSKSKKAAIAGKLHHKDFDDLGKVAGSFTLSPGWRLCHYLEFGMFQAVQGIDFNELIAAAGGDSVKVAVLNNLRKYQTDFAPVAQLIAKLDATRPIPTFTHLGVSPTLTRTLTALGLDAEGTTVTVCPIRWEEVETTDAKGNKRYHKIGHLEWPAGTVHDASRFNWIDRPRFSGCQACGHSIKNAWNWVPLVLTTPAGKTYSLWVGRDCAKRLFGIKVTGEVEIAE